jgi:hypothetical protein
MNAMITVLARNRTESGRKRAETVIPHQSLGATTVKPT